ncbi:MAG: hypothetical protein JWR83_2759 [Aeromicrobium sp.]|nr:hypothetical protein [Aeromicrobium sp.]
MTNTDVPPTIGTSATSTGVDHGKKLTLKLPDDRLRLATTLLFTAGAILMPLGLFAVGYGWYGAASTKYAYDQFPYLLSGGLTGVCLTTIGGFLYFGAWIAKGQADQRAAAQQLIENLQTLPERLARQLAALMATDGSTVDVGAAPVVAGTIGASVHRRDCRLIAHRDDLRPVAERDVGLSPCRVCNPVMP